MPTHLLYLSLVMNTLIEVFTTDRQSKIYQINREVYHKKALLSIVFPLDFAKISQILPTGWNVKVLAGAQFTPSLPLLRPRQLESKFALLIIEKNRKLKIIYIR